MPLRRIKITKEKLPLSDYLFRIGFVLLLFAVLLGLMVWVFSATTVLRETSP